MKYKLKRKGKKHAKEISFSWFYRHKPQNIRSTTGAVGICVELGVDRDAVFFTNVLENEAGELSWSVVQLVNNITMSFWDILRTRPGVFYQLTGIRVDWIYVGPDHDQLRWTFENLRLSFKRSKEGDSSGNHRNASIFKMPKRKRA